MHSQLNSFIQNTATSEIQTFSVITFHRLLSPLIIVLYSTVFKAHLQKSTFKEAI